MFVKSQSRVQIFHYTDYRQFLHDWYREAKKSRGSFSFRTFSKRAGFTSPNFFKLVMDGDRNLSEESLQKFIVGLKLNKQEQDFFRNLVFYNQSKDHEQKDRYYQNLIRSRKFNQLKPIDKQQYEYYSTWYHPVIRELVVSQYFDGTPESIFRRLSPEVTAAQVIRSIELLESLGFIEKNKSGHWKQSSSLVSTGAEVQSVAVFNYHKTLLDLTKEILDRVPAAKRDISTMTLGVKKGRIAELKKKIQEFRQEVLKMIAMDAEPEEVIQLNIQLFPVTKEEEDVTGEKKT